MPTAAVVWDAVGTVAQIATAKTRGEPPYLKATGSNGDATLWMLLTFFAQNAKMQGVAA